MSIYKPINSGALYVYSYEYVFLSVFESRQKMFRYGFRLELLDVVVFARLFARARGRCIPPHPLLTAFCWLFSIYRAVETGVCGAQRWRSL